MRLQYEAWCNGYSTPVDLAGTDPNLEMSRRVAIARRELRKREAALAVAEEAEAVAEAAVAAAAKAVRDSGAALEAAKAAKVAAAEMKAAALRGTVTAEVRGDVTAAAEMKAALVQSEREKGGGFRDPETRRLNIDGHGPGHGPGHGSGRGPQSLETGAGEREKEGGVEREFIENDTRMSSMGRRPPLKNLAASAAATAQPLPADVSAAGGDNAGEVVAEEVGVQGAHLEARHSLVNTEHQGLETGLVLEHQGLETGLVQGLVQGLETGAGIGRRPPMHNVAAPAVSVGGGSTEEVVAELVATEGLGVGGGGGGERAEPGAMIGRRPPTQSLLVHKERMQNTAARRAGVGMRPQKAFLTTTIKRP